jgi:hypothetical protein
MLERLKKSIENSIPTKLAFIGAGITVVALLIGVVMAVVNRNGRALPVLFLGTLTAIILAALTLTHAYTVFCMQEGGWSETGVRDKGCYTWSWVYAILVLITALMTSLPLLLKGGNQSTFTIAQGIYDKRK